ncbi:MAG: hypothetical protein AAGJ81_07075 [Verrucomicrobiota bacterium]
MKKSRRIRDLVFAERSFLPVILELRDTINVKEILDIEDENGEFLRRERG